MIPNEHTLPSNVAVFLQKFEKALAKFREGLFSNSERVVFDFYHLLSRILYATDRDCVGSINAFDVNGIVRDAQAEGVCFAVFVLAPKAGAPAEMAESAVVEAVACWEREEPEGILAGLVPETGAAKFTAVCFFIQMAQKRFPFLCARYVPTFRGNALVVFFSHLVVHFEIPGWSLFGEFGRDA